MTSRLAFATREQTRRELIAMAVRDTLKKHGIAAGCIAGEALEVVAAGRERGMHLQLVFKDWQPSLLSYVVALEASIRARLLRLDPLSANWITGVSWRFEPGQQWPQMPSGKWTAASTAARQALRTGTRRSVEKLLESGDTAFGAGARTPDFSPTLPMQHVR